MAVVAITHLFLVLANCVIRTETELEDKRRRIFFLNIVHKRYTQSEKPPRCSRRPFSGLIHT